MSTFLGFVGGMSAVYWLWWGLLILKEGKDNRKHNLMSGAVMYVFFLLLLFTMLLNPA